MSTAERRYIRKLRKQLRRARSRQVLNWAASRHHRRPHSRGGSNKKANISIVSQDLHRLWHQMWGNMTTDEIASELQNVWLEQGYRVVIERR